MKVFFLIRRIGNLIDFVQEKNILLLRYFSK